MKVKFSITGMHCDRCCSTLVEAFKAVPGCVDCNVEVGMAEVTYDESQAGKSDFIAAIQANGAFAIQRLETIT